MIRLLSVPIVIFCCTATGVVAQTLHLSGKQVQIQFEKQSDGWHVTDARAKGKSDWIALANPIGRYTVLFINRNPSHELTDLDREGVAYPFFPADAQQCDDGSIVFQHSLPVGDLSARWSIDPNNPNDIHVKMTFVSTKRGIASIATPTLAAFAPGDIAWGMVPGNWYGSDIQSNFELSPGYSQGIPNRSYLVTERNTMTLCPLIESKLGLTLGVIPDPGIDRDPWEQDKSTRELPRMGISTMNRFGQFTPTIYHPMLTQEPAMKDPGATVEFGFCYSLQAKPWFSVFAHAAMDIYRLPELLTLQTSREPLAERVNKLATMLSDDGKSAWKVVELSGVQIGANGTKTSDVGAMQMLARASNQQALRDRLPFIRNYKLLQQQMTPGFFQHAATGEYPGESGFVAERGNWIEPLFTTYYTMLDMGNISLFDPKDQEIKDRIRLAGDKLLAWQHDDGSFDVAYDSLTHVSSFPQLTDVRPTWYGFVVAARILGDEKYLAAARKGADWYLANAVAKGHYLGACGDALNKWDFTTVFGAQSLLDLYDLTHDPKYQKAAIDVAQVYATTIFTHPIATSNPKTVAGKKLADWQISQVGLSVEHIRGTANSGPVLLSSHCGLFVRMYELTREPIFLDLARAAARGRQHFTDPNTGMAVYYWNAIDKIEKIANLFPWHAEWQVGWITDYLLSEAHLRTAGQVSFPSGFPTPKVGSHVSYGFAPGAVFGRQADLWLGNGAVKSDNPNSEYVSAIATDHRSLFLVAMNQFAGEQTITLNVDSNQSAFGQSIRWTSAKALQGTLLSSDSATGNVRVQLPAWGAAVIELELSR